MYPDKYDDLIVESRTQFDSLNAQTKIAWCLHRLEAEVNNGGFYQFLSNSSGAYAYETIEALNVIGARQTSELLNNAVVICFPSGYPVKPQQYESALASITDDIEDELEPLDAAFYDYVEPLEDMVNAYINKESSQ